jgi:bacteriorhodopsin
MTTFRVDGGVERRGVVSSVAVPLLVAALSVFSLAIPVIAPAVAAVCGFAMFRSARRTGSRWCWFAASVCAFVVVAGLVIDFGLLSATSSSGVAKVTVSPN